MLRRARACITSMNGASHRSGLVLHHYHAADDALLTIGPCNLTAHINHAAPSAFMDRAQALAAHARRDPGNIEKRNFGLAKEVSKPQRTPT